MAMAIYFFNGKDITTNMIIQIRGVINVLQRRMNISFPDAALKFYTSETYKTLQQTETVCGQNQPNILPTGIMKKWDLTQYKMC